MNPRREFFTALFAALDANGVRYCIMRNYDQLCTGTETDVDVLVSEYSSARFAKCLRDVARQTGFRFVHAARYVNYSHVFWHPQAGFIRMDFETEVRWRVFPVLSSREVLDARQLHDGFYIPHPKHESAIIWVAAVWRGFLSDRYRAQLARLYAACPDKSELRAALRGAFGSADHALAEFQSKLPTGEFNRAFCSRVRRSLVGSALRGRRRFCRLVQNVTTDGLRLVERLRRPAGFSLLFVSRQRPPAKLRRLDPPH